MTALEARICERLAEFKREKEDVPSLQQQIAALEEKLGSRHDYALETQLASLKDRLDDILTGRSETQYLLDIIPFVQEEARVETSSPRLNHTTGILHFVQVEGTTRRGKQLNDYKVQVEKTYEGVELEKPPDPMICEACNESMFFINEESVLVCPECAQTRYFMECSTSNMSYEQEVNQEIITSYAYKRINHFNEWLAGVQGKENTEIPPEILDSLKAEFKKVRTTKTNQIKPSKVREFLKKLRLTKYYEHVHHITNLLNGIPNTRIPAALESRLRTMFQEIQSPWERTKPKNRSNFFSYSYVLYKCCELLGADEYLHLFPLLKSTEKLYQQDQMWKLVCRELNWEFRPSV
jgi:hypothetical protein